MKLGKFRKFKNNGGKLSNKLLEKIPLINFKRVLLPNRLIPVSQTARRVNTIMNQKSYRYLEIGVQHGFNLEAILCNDKTGVDPNPLFNPNKLPNNSKFFLSKSDDFFNKLETDSQFDFIFIDGLHEANQVLKDVFNALKHSKPNSWILVDDIIPIDFISGISNQKESIEIKSQLNRFEKSWQGDCYKIYPVLMNYFTGIELFIFIYPNNPQLLIRISEDGFNYKLKTLTADNHIKEMSNYELRDWLSSDNLRNLPIFVEDILFLKFIEERLIAENSYYKYVREKCL